LIKFIDLFAGTGGIRLALEQACKSFNIPTKCVLSSEIDKNACLSYELNFGEKPSSDIRKIYDFPDFNFLLAGFPCQAFSYAGKQKGFGDTRGTLFFEVERILKEKRPKYFLLENVRGLTTHDKGRTFETIKKNLTDLGYSIDYFLLNSSDFNVPQNRVRIYIVGILNQEIKMTLQNSVGASDTHAFKAQLQPTLFDTFIQPKVVKDILEKNPNKKYHCSQKFTKSLKKLMGENLSKLNGYRLTDYRGGNSIHSWELDLKGSCTPHEIEFMNLLISNRRKKIFGTHQDGKSLTKEQILTFYPYNDFDKVTISLIKKGYLGILDKKYKPVCGNMSFEVFKFLDSDGISITLTASDSNRLGIVQDNIPRRLTPRECARLQGYPDSYKLLDNDNAIYKQMGNGVSVPVVEAVLEDFIKHNLLSKSKNLNTIKNKDFMYSNTLFPQQTSTHQTM